MVQEDPVPQYTEHGNIEDDLRRLAEASNVTTAPTQDTVVAPPPPSNRLPELEVNSGDPDTDDLIRRLLREDAEEAEASRPTPRVAPPIPDVVESYFEAIRNENSELISAFIDNGIVKVDTKDKNGVTPLVAAVRANHVRIVQQLVDYGADVDQPTSEKDPEAPFCQEWRRGRRIKNPYERMQRTPLMAAAENGHLPLAKLLFEVFHAKDDFVPPDGMTALRLAAKNGHREVVDFLPSRRIGGLQRWQYKNKKSIRRGRIILMDIYHYLKIIFYEIPRFFVWSIPKHVVVLPVKRTSVYLWKHKKEIAKGIKDGFVATGKGIAKYSKKAVVGTVKGIKAIPSVTVKATKATWKFLTVGFPKLLLRFIKATLKFIKDAAIAIKQRAINSVLTMKDFIIWFAKKTWKLITVTIPKLIKLTVKWIWQAIKYVGKTISGFVIRLVSAIHTLLTKMVNWFSSITWKDVLNGFKEALKFVFLAIPLMIVDGLKHTRDFVLKVLETLFGWVGEIIYYIGLSIVIMVTYVPVKIFELFVELFKSIGRGLHEVAVWINPKTI